MKLPQPSAGYEQRVHFGRYTAARLKKARRADQAASVEQATNKVKAGGRTVGDAVEPMQTAIALRDAADNDMDVAAQEFRKQLAARRLGAEKEPPYTLVFPQGIGYYIAAPLAENVNRYNELITRVRANLPADDALAAALLPAITAGLADFTAATDRARPVPDRPLHGPHRMRRGGGRMGVPDGKDLRQPDRRSRQESRGELLPEGQALGPRRR